MRAEPAASHVPNTALFFWRVVLLPPPPSEMPWGYSPLQMKTNKLPAREAPPPSSHGFFATAESAAMHASARSAAAATPVLVWPKFATASSTASRAPELSRRTGRSPRGLGGGKAAGVSATGAQVTLQACAVAGKESRLRRQHGKR